MTALERAIARPRPVHDFGGAFAAGRARSAQRRLPRRARASRWRPSPRRRRRRRSILLVSGVVAVGDRAVDHASRRSQSCMVARTIIAVRAAAGRRGGSTLHLRRRVASAQGVDLAAGAAILVGYGVDRRCSHSSVGRTTSPFLVGVARGPNGGPDDELAAPAALFGGAVLVDRAGARHPPVNSHRARRRSALGGADRGASSSCCSCGSVRSTRRGRARPPAFVSAPALAAGSVIALTAFVGFESASTLGVEARAPLRNVPRAIVWTVVVARAALRAGGGTRRSRASRRSARDLAASRTRRSTTSPSAFGLGGWGAIADVGIAASFLACAIGSTTALTRVLFTHGPRRDRAAAARGGARPVRHADRGVASRRPAHRARCRPASCSSGVGVWRRDAGRPSSSRGSGYIVAYVLVCVAAPVVPAPHR